MIRVCCVDLPFLECAWLTLEPAPLGSPVIYRSTFHDDRFVVGRPWDPSVGLRTYRRG